jgi:hypothetical protein
MAIKLSALLTHRILLPTNIIIFMFLVPISVRGRVNPRAYIIYDVYIRLKFPSV